MSGAPEYQILRWTGKDGKCSYTVYNHGLVLSRWRRLWKARLVVRRHKRNSVRKGYVLVSG